MAAVTTSKQVGIVGAINGYQVVVLGDTVSVMRNDAEVARETVSGLGRFIAGTPDLKLGCAELPDFECVYLYGADGFGYGINLTWGDGSEWGFSPFSP